MKLSEIKDALQLAVAVGEENLDVEVTAGYCSDLLSDVMGNAEEGTLWITLQIHENIVAVATLKQLSGILLVNRRAPAENTVRKAREEGVPILTSELSAFELAGRLHAMGLRG